MECACGGFDAVACSRPYAHSLPNTIHKLTKSSSLRSGKKQDLGWPGFSHLRLTEAIIPLFKAFPSPVEASLVPPQKSEKPGTEIWRSWDGARPPAGGRTVRVPPAPSSGTHPAWEKHWAFEFLVPLKIYGKCCSGGGCWRKSPPRLRCCKAKNPSFWGVFQGNQREASFVGGFCYLETIPWEQKLAGSSYARLPVREAAKSFGMN